MDKEINKKLISELYLENRLSMVQIAERLNISPSSVRYCLDKGDIQRRDIGEAINSWYFTKLNKKPFQLKLKLSFNDQKLKIAGIMLYWGEGSKTGNTVKFSNSDPDMTRIFLLFLRNICGIREERLKALIHVYPDLNEKKLKLFWSKVTNIPIKNFYKSHVHKGKKGTYKNKTRYGTLAISYSDKRLLQTILNWISAYKKADLPE